MNDKSEGYLHYLNEKKRKKRRILRWQLILLVGFIGLWEVAARLGWLNTFYLVALVKSINFFSLYRRWKSF